MAGSVINEENLRLLTMGLFTAPGTPILNHFETIDNSTSTLIKELSKKKTQTAIKFGKMEFVNTTNPDVIAFTR